VRAFRSSDLMAMRIAIDAMGGDQAPSAPVAGALRAVKEDGATVVLVGDEERVRAELRALGVEGELPATLAIRHAEEVVGMDEPAITPLRKKRRSSIRICAELVGAGEAEAMVSAGNTGAAMIAAKVGIGLAPGVDRPALAAALPNATGWTVLLDVGANVDLKPNHLRQFAVMGAMYAQVVGGVAAPRVGLLSIGEEEGKGTAFTREVFRSLESSDLNFLGNVEGSDVFEGTCDVIVCDGFVGNVVLKSAEALAEMLMHMIREEIGKSPLTRFGGGLCKPAFLRLRQRTHYDQYGGAPLLGLRGGCFIAHGRANPLAVQNAIRRAVSFAEGKVHERISQRLAELHFTAEDAARLEPPAPAPVPVKVASEGSTRGAKAQ
jgi:glycerol-3-phosphate acyltransferase PlsX